MLLFNVLFKSVVLCADTVIYISGKILRSVRQKLIVISGISIYRRSLYRGSVPYILLQLLPGQKHIYRYTGDIVISRIIVSGYHCTS